MHLSDHGKAFAAHQGKQLLCDGVDSAVAMVAEANVQNIPIETSSKIVIAEICAQLRLQLYVMQPKTHGQKRPQVQL